MKLSHPKIGLLLLALLVSASGCGYINSIRAKSQLNEAVSSYKEKKFDEAEEHARKALELDKDNENAPLILAIVLRTQYRQNEYSDVNNKRAKEAIQLYRAVEEKNPNDDEAFTAVTRLTGFLAQAAGQQAEKLEQQAGEAQDPNEKSKLTAKAAELRKEEEDLKNEQLAWVKKRAENGGVTDARRSDAYAFLADEEWSKSIAVTDSPKNKEVVIPAGGGEPSTRYKKPENQEEYNNAVKAMTDGLALAETAVKLNSENETALAEKYKLLLEAGKLAKMEGDEKKAKDYEDQAKAVKDQGAALHNKAKAAPAPSPQPAG